MRPLAPAACRTALSAIALMCLVACKSGGEEPAGGPPEPVAEAAAPVAEPAAEPAGASAEPDTRAEEDAAPAFDPEPWLTRPEDLAAPPKAAEKRRSGLVSRVLKEGEGDDRPRAEDVAVVHYSIWREDGKLIESSAKREEPRAFRVGKQIPGWEEALQLLTVGERRRFWIPQKLAFRGRPGKPRGTLVWDAELVEIRRAPDAPPDVAKPPKDANRTESGLAWKELSPGEGDATPSAASTVMVHYTGWTTDGASFDSTAYEGTPATFTLANVIEGWTEGIQLMKRGQKVRFWIPQELAYGGKKGKPKGMLVFDVELIDFSQ